MFNMLNNDNDNDKVSSKEIKDLNKVGKSLSKKTKIVLLSVGVGAFIALAVYGIYKGLNKNIQNDVAQNIQVSGSYPNEFYSESDRYIDSISEMLDAGYIDQTKANNFINNIDSDDIKLEIGKTYDLFLVDLDVKEGYYSAELGELEKQLIEADYAGNDALYNEIYSKYEEQWEKDFGDSGDSYVSDDYPSLVKEMLDAGYIDQAKADNFNNNINSESTQMEIDKTYDLFLVDLNVKEGYYSAELGELGKLVIEAEYSVDGLSEELYNRYMDQLEKEGFLVE